MAGEGGGGRGVGEGRGSCTPEIIKIMLAKLSIDRDIKRISAINGAGLFPCSLHVPATRQVFPREGSAQKKKNLKIHVRCHIEVEAAGRYLVISPSHSILTPSHNSILTPSHSILTPSHSILTPRHSILTPSHSILTPSHSILTPSHSILTPSHSTLTIY